VSTEPIVRDEHVQRAVWFAGALAHLRAGAAETGGRWAMVDQVAERGYSVPLHIHNREAETLLVIDGTVRVVCGDAEYLLSAGGLTILPMGRSHAFVVTSPTARILALTEPAGLRNSWPRSVRHAPDPVCRRSQPPHRTSPRLRPSLHGTASRSWDRRRPSKKGTASSVDSAIPVRRSEEHCRAPLHLHAGSDDNAP
jgi:quercetin dioxygenase-like cupin family protein